MKYLILPVVFLISIFEKTIHGTLNFGSKKWAALVSSTFTDFNDLRMGSSGPTEYLRLEYVAPGKFDGSDEIIQNENELMQKFTGYNYNQFNLLSKFRYRPGDELDVTLSALHSQTSDIPRYDRLIACRNDKFRYGNWFYGPQKWALVSGNVLYQKNHLFFDKVSLLAGYQDYQESRHDRGLNDENLRHRTENLDVFSLNLDLRKTIDSRNEIFYGGEAFLNQVGSSGFSENLIDRGSEKIAPRYPDNSTYNSFAAYASYKFKYSERLILQAGARFTQTLLSGDFDAGFYDFPFSGFNMKNSALNGQDSIMYDGTLSNVEALVNAESAQIMGGSFSFSYLFTPFFRTQHHTHHGN